MLGEDLGDRIVVAFFPYGKNIHVFMLTFKWYKSKLCLPLESLYDGLWQDRDTDAAGYQKNQSLCIGRAVNDSGNKAGFCKCIRNRSTVFSS